MPPENVWEDPKTWIAIGSLGVGFFGAAFGVLSFRWNRHESRLDALSKILQPMVAAAQKLLMANNCRQRCETLKRSFPTPENAPEAIEQLKMLMDQYGELVGESVEQFRLAESEFASRSFRFPDKIAKLIDKAMKSLSLFGRHVNEGLFQKAELQLAAFRDDYGQITKEGRGWRLADPFEWLKKRFQKGKTEVKSPHKYDISEKDMEILMELVHKRATTQAHNNFAVHPPKKLADRPEIARSENVIKELDDSVFVVAFQDGTSRMMTLAELMVFTFNLLQLAHQTIEVNRIAAATGGVPQEVTVSFRLSIDEIMRPEMVRALLARIEFSKEPSDTGTP